jgi:malate/lactate dehydrogenase
MKQEDIKAKCKGCISECKDAQVITIGLTGEQTPQISRLHGLRSNGVIVSGLLQTPP